MSDPAQPCPWVEAGPRGAGLVLDDYPAALLMRAATSVQMAYTSVYAREHGLSVPEWRILGRLHESAPIHITALCKISLFDKAYAGRVLRELESRGLVVLRPDEEHGRRQIAELTAEGRRLVQTINPIARRNQMRILEALDDDERRVLYRSLHKLIDAAQSLRPTINAKASS